MHMTISTAVLLSSLFISHVVALPVTTRNIDESAVEKREPILAACKGTREACERMNRPKPHVPKPYSPRPFIACKGINCNNALSPWPRISDGVNPVVERDINSAVEKRERVSRKPNSLLGKPISPPSFACASINGCGRDPLYDVKHFWTPDLSASVTKNTPNNGIKRDEAEVEKREADQKVEEFLNSLETRDADSDFVNSLGRREADQKVEEFLNSLETRGASLSNDLETRNQPSNLDNALGKPASPPFQIPGPPSNIPTNNRRPKRPAKSLFDASCAGDVHNCSKVKPIRFDPSSIA